MCRNRSVKQIGEWGDKDGGWAGPHDAVLDSRLQGLNLVQRALGSQEDFKQGRDRVRFCFRKIPLAAIGGWTTAGSRQTGSPGQVGVGNPHREEPWERKEGAGR